MHWQFRLWRDNQTNEEPVVGEPFIDTIRKRIGVFFGGSTYRWFPRITDNGIRIDTGSNLSGMTDDQTENTLVFDFNTPGEIRVVDTTNNAIIARHTANGSFFKTASITGTQPFGGLINQIINGNINILRYFKSTISVSALNLSALIAPNWQLWCSKLNGGNLTASIDNSDVPTGCTNAIKLVVESPCYSGGLRTFVHSALPFVGKQCTFWSLIKGPIGQTCKFRILTDKGVIGVVVVNCTGMWQKVSYSVDFAVNPMVLGSTIIAIEPIYAPTYGTNNIWRVAATQMNQGMAVQDLETRSLETEKSLLKSIYQNFKRNINATDYLSWDMLDDNIVVESSSTALTFSNTSAIGSNVLNNSGSIINADITVYRLPQISL